RSNRLRDPVVTGDKTAVKWSGETPMLLTEAGFFPPLPTWAALPLSKRGKQEELKLIALRPGHGDGCKA
ncbi:MAG: hypothetical protein AAF551_13260, partial [Bacteroidota bacterium]